MPMTFNRELIEPSRELIPPKEMPEPWTMRAMELGWYFRIPRSWGTRWVMRELEHVDYEDSFKLVVVNPGERYIQRVLDLDHERGADTAAPSPAAPH